MDVRSERIVQVLALAGVILASRTMCAGASASLVAPRPTSAAAQGTRVVIPPPTVPLSGAAGKVSPQRSVLYAFHGPPVAVCTTFPGTVSLDGAGNVYKQPVEIDTRGHERAVGFPVSLTPPKQIGDVTTTAKP